MGNLAGEAENAGLKLHFDRHLRLEFRGAKVTTAASHHCGMVLEVMGRNAGWIALCAGIAGGGDIILIPEIEYTFENVVRSVEERRARKAFQHHRGRGRRAPSRGGKVYRPEPGGEKALGGVGEKVAERIGETAGMQTRVTVLGHLQRGGSPSPLDRILATGFGIAAVELAVAGRSGLMVGLRGNCVQDVPLEEAIPGQRKVPVDGDLVSFARSVGTSFGD